MGCRLVEVYSVGGLVVRFCESVLLFDVELFHQRMQTIFLKQLFAVFAITLLSMGMRDLNFIVLW